MNLPQNCSNCENFEGCFCTLPEASTLIHGFIKEPEKVVCVMWAKKDEDEPEADATPTD